MTAMLWVVVAGFGTLGMLVVLAPWYAFRFEHVCVPAGCDCRSLALRAAP